MAHKHYLTPAASASTSLNEKPGSNMRIGSALPYPVVPMERGSLRATGHTYIPGFEQSRASVPTCSDQSMTIQHIAASHLSSRLLLSPPSISFLISHFTPHPLTAHHDLNAIPSPAHNALTRSTTPHSPSHSSTPPPLPTLEKTELGWFSANAEMEMGDGRYQTKQGCFVK